MPEKNNFILKIIEHLLTEPDKSILNKLIYLPSEFILCCFITPNDAQLFDCNMNFTILSKKINKSRKHFFYVIGLDRESSGF